MTFRFWWWRHWTEYCEHIHRTRRRRRRRHIQVTGVSVLKAARLNIERHCDNRHAQREFIRVWRCCGPHSLPSEAARRALHGPHARDQVQAPLESPMFELFSITLGRAHVIGPEREREWLAGDSARILGSVIATAGRSLFKRGTIEARGHCFVGSATALRTWSGLSVLVARSMLG